MLTAYYTVQHTHTSTGTITNDFFYRIDSVQIKYCTVRVQY